VFGRASHVEASDYANNFHVLLERLALHKKSNPQLRN